MMRGEAGAAARGFEAAGRGADRGAGTSDPGDILRRIASVIGEIDALKRERHATPVLDARAKLAEIYFRKRPARRRFREAASAGER